MIISKLCIGTQKWLIAIGAGRSLSARTFGMERESTRLRVLTKQLGDALPILSEVDLRLGTRFLETRKITQQALLFLLEVFDLCQQVLRNLAPRPLVVRRLLA